MLSCYDRWAELRGFHQRWGIHRWVDEWRCRTCIRKNSIFQSPLSPTQLSTCAREPCRTKPGWTWRIMRRWVPTAMSLHLSARQPWWDLTLCKGYICMCVCGCENDGKYFSKSSVLFRCVAFSFQQENLARLQRAFARKWEFIYMQAEAQVKWVSSATVAT